jgi:hypothetical protein
MLLRRHGYTQIRPGRQLEMGRRVGHGETVVDEEFEEGPVNEEVDV